MNEVYVPKISPVRIKTEEIPRSLINPGSMGHDFPQGVGPRVVYLDERYEYPDDSAVSTEDAERARQAEIWRQVDADRGLKFLDRRVEASIWHRTLASIREGIYEELGTRNSAEFYEKFFSQLMNKTIDVVVIATGIRPFDGENYHDIGYHPVR